MSVKKMIDDEKNWQEVLHLRSVVEKDFGSLNGALEAGSAVEAINKAICALNQIIPVFVRNGADLENSDPGHGVGHVLRDYLNGLAVMNSLKCNPAYLVPGFIAGVLHDFGCAMVPRYDDPKRAVRHAEVGGLMLADVFKECNCGLSEAEQLVSVYSVMAHTHYLRPAIVSYEDGSTREISPYSDMLTPDEPFLPIWLPRWVDRLDCNGPCYPGRHFLTLAEEKMDFDGKDFHSQDFFKQMRPVSKETAGHPTMLSHMQMFCGSQTNQSPYGKYDFGSMVKIRDMYCDWLNEIIQSVTQPLSAEENTLFVWTEFLKKNCEPSTRGKNTADKLYKMFRTLAPEMKGWNNGFKTSMRLYIAWYEEMNKQLMKMPSDWQIFPGNLIGDARGFDYLIEPIAEVRELF